MTERRIFKQVVRSKQNQIVKLSLDPEKSRLRGKETIETLRAERRYDFSRVDAIASDRQHLLRDFGGEDLELHMALVFAALLNEEHRQRVRLLTCRAPDRPGAYPV